MDICAETKKTKPADLSEQKSSGTQPGTGFWIVKYILMMLGWDPPSVRLVTLLAVTSAVHVKCFQPDIVSLVISWIVVFLNMVCNRFQRLILTALEISLVWWINPVYFRTIAVNEGMLLFIYLLSLELVSGFKSETGAGRH